MLHHLDATPETTVVGTIDPAATPVLFVESGDEIELSTLHLWGGDITPETTMADMAAVSGRCLAAGALGAHTLTGPIAVAGAEPGDVLRIDILELVPGPHGWNAILPPDLSTGALTDRFPEPSIAHYALNRKTMTAEVAPGLTLPLRPFLGIMGVAPEGVAPRGTAEPGPFGGNMDCRDLVAGTTFAPARLPPGAGFYAGDAHGMQGDGEVNMTAMETTMERARLRLTVERGDPILLPRIDAADHVSVLAFDRDLDEAARVAVAEATDLIAARRAIDAETAYRLCSLAVDLAVTQIVNGVKGVHARIPRTLLER